MPYVRAITEPLIETLTHAAGLPVNQLAGHAANLGFWVGEVEHALKVIDGYSERFRSLQLGERRFGQQNQVHPSHSKPVRPGISDHELKELRRRLVDTAKLFLSRCRKEDLVSEAELNELLARLDLDPGELRG